MFHARKTGLPGTERLFSLSDTRYVRYFENFHSENDSAGETHRTALSSGCALRLMTAPSMYGVQGVYGVVYTG